MMQTEQKSDDLYYLTTDQLFAINEGIAQLDNGYFVSNEEANKQADEWLKKEMV